VRVTQKKTFLSAWFRQHSEKAEVKNVRTHVEIKQGFERAFIDGVYAIGDTSRSVTIFLHHDQMSFAGFIREKRNEGWTFDYPTLVSPDCHSYILRKTEMTPSVKQFARSFSLSKVHDDLKAKMELAFNEAREKAEGNARFFYVDLCYGSFGEAETMFVAAKEAEGWICTERLKSSAPLTGRRKFTVPSVLFLTEARAVPESGEKQQDVVEALNVS